MTSEATVGPLYVRRHRTRDLALLRSYTHSSVRNLIGDYPVKSLTDTLTARLTIPFAMLVLGLAATVLGLAGFLWLRGGTATLDEVLKILATGVGATTAIYAAMSFARLNAAHQETVHLKKLEMTSKLIDKWLDPKCAELIQSVGRFLKLAPMLSPDELAKKIDEDEKLRGDAMFILNLLEAIALELKHDALHPELTREFFRGIVVIYHNRLSGLIALGRRRTDNPKMFCELEELADAWSSK